jgi:rifampicin phosphotransferase
VIEAKWTPPSAGSWELEQTHLVRPMSRWLGPLFAANMMRGFKDFTPRYGMLLDHLEIALINGFGYATPRPVGAPKGAKGPPPKLVFKILTKLHPEIRRRIKRSAQVWQDKTWREDARRWHDDWQPAVIAANRELAAIDPRSLDDDALASYLAKIKDRCVEAIYRHHSMNGCCMVPLGDFLVHASTWTGMEPRALVALLRGSSPVSCGAKQELARLGAALRADAAAAAIVASPAPSSEILSALRAATGETGEAARAYLAEVELRLITGYDVGERLGIEMPDVLVGAIRAAAADARQSRDAEDALVVAGDTAKVRALVPEEHRAEFDALLEEARFVYPIRDERGYNNDAMASGLARRALLVAGERLVARGKLEAADHAVDLTCDEVLALLAGKPGPAKEEVAERVTYRTTHTVADAPPHLGIPPSAPPPAEWLPPPAARMARAVAIILGHMFAVPVREDEKPERKLVRGLAASPGMYEGRARIVDGPEQFSKIEKGDILVTRMTSPSFNVLLPLLGGVVTDRGGLLSHAAIVAREYGLPAVVGTTDGTRVIPDAARVRVDGGMGEVLVL